MFSVILLQAAMTVLIGLLFWLIQGWVAAYSAWLGGLTALLPNMYFTYKAFQYFGARSIAVIVQSFWAGEMGKLILTALLFAVLFLGVKPLNVLAVFIGYILVQMTSATSLLLTKSFLKR
ncbi:F0F1 ATP synthase subunit I [Denitrificimonas caeni]|uniref:F0F1 ATP synthase subunit I n=1 Tax=Denitrificimonas caeni TaxID=521720 RepID=UPI0019657E21|nr:F0F1 ATP synthase subunit I [Denitrificimonas caeni]